MIPVCYSECNVVSNECNEPTSFLVQPIGTHGGEVIYFGCVCFRGELGFLNCDDICMCVVNKQFELIEFVLNPFMLTCIIMSVLCLYSCGRLWSVSEVVVVPYVDAVVAVTVMRVLLLVVHVWMLRECKGDHNAGVGLDEVWLW